MSIVGVTIDYGPYGFMDKYDPNFICNASGNDSVFWLSSFGKRQKNIRNFCEEGSSGSNETVNPS